MIKCIYLSNLVHNGAFLHLFLFFHHKEGLSLVSHSSLFTHSNASVEKMVKGGKDRNSCWAGIWAAEQLTMTTGNRFTPNFPKSFLQNLFSESLLWSHQKSNARSTGERAPNLLEGCTVPQGALCLIPGLILKIL